MSKFAGRLAVVAGVLASDAREAVVAARKAGFAGMQFDAFAEGLNITELSITGRREFSRILARENLKLVGLRAELGAKGFGPGADVDRLLGQLTKVMEAAKGLGAPLLCLDVGVLPQPPKAPVPEKAKITPDMAGLILLPGFAAAPAPEVTSLSEVPAKVDPVFVAQVNAAAMELGAIADRLGVTVALRSDLSSFAAIEAIIKTSGCPWFGVDLDPVGILRDDWVTDEVFDRLGRLIRHVRGRDATLGTQRRTTPAVVGKGSTDWVQLVAALDDAGYGGWITIDSAELNNRAQAAAAGRQQLDP